MKKSVLILGLAIACLLSSAKDKQTGSGESFRLVLDSVFIYRYDQTLKDWNLSSVNYYFIGPEITDSVITCDANRNPLSRIVYTVNAEGMTGEAYSFDFIAGQWITTEHQVLSYNSGSLLSQRTVTRWDGLQWNNLNRFSYVYHDNDLLRSYHREIWRNSIWLPYSVDTLIYDENDRLTERTATRKSDGDFILRTLTDYDSLGRKDSRLRQDYLNGIWVNVLLDKYNYDGCGNEIGSVTQKWNIDGWTDDTKTVTFFHVELTETDGKHKIPVCHNGKTLYVPATAFRAHIRHGDCPGECAKEKNVRHTIKDCSQVKTDPPFIIFPNPASDKITIKFRDQQNTDVQQVELTDFHGKLIKSYRVNGNGEQIIYREGLMSGKYYIRLIGREIFSTIVIFE